MNYGKVLSRAWEITWRWKILWILGFLAALGQGGGGGNGISYTTDSGEWGGYKMPPEMVGVILTLVCLALIVGIAIWVVSVIARGGLIAGVQQVEEEGETSFGEAWRAGAKRFWTLFGLGILAALPLIVMGLLGAIGVVIAILSGVAITDAGARGAAGIVIPAVFCGTTFCCGMIVLAIILEQVRIYAERAAILEDLGWIEAFKRGWEVLKANLGPTIILWLIFFAIGIILFTIIFVVVMASLIPFIAVVASVEPGAWIAIPVCCGGLLAIIVGALLGAIIETFGSATWTLAYREMTGLAEPAAE